MTGQRPQGSRCRKWSRRPGAGWMRCIFCSPAGAFFPPPSGAFFAPPPVHFSLPPPVHFLLPRRCIFPSPVRCIFRSPLWCIFLFGSWAFGGPAVSDRGTNKLSMKCSRQVSQNGPFPRPKKVQVPVPKKCTGQVQICLPQAVQFNDPPSPQIDLVVLSLVGTRGPHWCDPTSIDCDTRGTAATRTLKRRSHAPRPSASGPS